MSKITGKAQELTLDGAIVKTTKVGLKISKETVDSTDSADYDAVLAMYCNSQLAVSAAVELPVEGFFHNVNSATIADVLMKCYAAAAVAVGALKIDGTNTLATGKWDVTDFEADSPHMDMVTFKATLKSNGKITFTDVPVVI